MLPLNQKVTRSSLVSPIFYVAKNGNKKIEGSSWAEQIMLPPLNSDYIKRLSLYIVFLP